MVWAAGTQERAEPLEEQGPCCALDRVRAGLAELDRAGRELDVEALEVDARELARRAAELDFERMARDARRLGAEWQQHAKELASHYGNHAGWAAAAPSEPGADHRRHQQDVARAQAELERARASQARGDVRRAEQDVARARTAVRERRDQPDAGGELDRRLAELEQLLASGTHERALEHARLAEREAREVAGCADQLELAEALELEGFEGMAVEFEDFGEAMAAEFEDFGADMGRALAELEAFAWQEHEHAEHEHEHEHADHREHARGRVHVEGWAQAGGLDRGSERPDRADRVDRLDRTDRVAPDELAFGPTDGKHESHGDQGHAGLAWAPRPDGQAHARVGGAVGIGGARSSADQAELRELVGELRGEVEALRAALSELRAQMGHLSAGGAR